MTKTGTANIALIITACLSLGACSGGSDNAATEASNPVPDQPRVAAPPTLAEKLADESRAEADRGRDDGRKPAQVIAFLGIEPGMTVVDVIGAGGYYTEVLSIAVGPDGRVAALNPPSVMQFREGANEKALTERLANDRLPNVYRLDKDIGELTAEDGAFDAAITALNLHDIYNRNGEDVAVGMMTSIYNALKPGGIFGVIDHEGTADNDNAELHRMQRADAIRVAEAAGFIVEAEGDVLQNPDDDMTQHMRSEGLRGYTNRFLLKLRKPES